MHVFVLPLSQGDNCTEDVEDGTGAADDDIDEEEEEEETASDVDEKEKPQWKRTSRKRK